jgi:hypothetical protein
MMRNVLILAADSADLAEHRRVGDLFDQALVEIVHALDVPAGVANVLVPWSTDLSPLIAASIVDTAPTFDPEGDRKEATSRSGLVPYLLPGAETSDQGASFFRSSHLALGRAAPLPFADVISKHPPTDIVVLAWIKGFAQSLNVQAHVNLVTFGSLAPSTRVASALNVPPSRVIDLELRLPRIVEDKDLPDSREFADERGRDTELEPFIPFGLLIQDYFDNLLPDDETSTRRER